MKIKKSLKNLFQFRWQPTRDIAIVFISWALVMFLNYIAYAKDITIYAIVFGVFLLILGMGLILPVGWAVYRKKSLASIGITSKYWLKSLLLGIILTLGFEVIPYITGQYGGPFPSGIQLFALILLALIAGLFEAVYFRGFVQLRLEKSFGIIPSIIVASVLYSLYHIGYGGTWVAPSTLFTLVIIGIIFAVIFRITKNILIIWPFAIPFGAMAHMAEIEAIDKTGLFANLVPMIPYYIAVLILMGIITWIGIRKTKSWQEE